MAHSQDDKDRIIDEVCARLSNGESLRRICETAGMPNRLTIFRWLESNETYVTKYAHARIVQADYMDDRVLDVIDDVASGKLMSDVARVMLAGLQWRAEKLNAKKYGPAAMLKLANHDGSKDAAININIGAQEAIDAAMRMITKARTSVDDDIIENIPYNDGI